MVTNNNGFENVNITKLWYCVVYIPISLIPNLSHLLWFMGESLNSQYTQNQEKENQT